MSNPSRESSISVGDRPNRFEWVPVWRNLTYPQRDHVRTAGFYAVLGVTLLVILFPMFWMFSTALRPREAMFARNLQLLPSPLTFEHFVEIFTNTNFPRYYFNSALVSVGVVGLTTTAATLGGYGLSRIEFAYNKQFARLLLFGYMFPPILLSIPMFIFWRQFGILNTYVGLILAETAIALPFSLWLMWKFFQAVPPSLEESARMAGATRFGAFWDIALPMAKPGMIAVAIQSYAVSWNSFTMPRVLMTDIEKWPLTIGLFSFVQQNNVLWGQLMAACALTIVPAFVFIFFLQKYLLRGFSVGEIG